MNLEVEIGIAKLEPDAVTPTQGSAQAAGWDLYALEETIVKKYQSSMIRTGIAVATVSYTHLTLPTILLV